MAGPSDCRGGGIVRTAEGDIVGVRRHIRTAATTEPADTDRARVATVELQTTRAST